MMQILQSCVYRQWGLTCKMMTLSLLFSQQDRLLGNA